MEKKTCKEDSSDDKDHNKGSAKLAAIFEENTEEASCSKQDTTVKKMPLTQKLPHKFSFKRSVTNVEDFRHDKKTKYQTNTRKTLKKPTRFFSKLEHKKTVQLLTHDDDDDSLSPLSGEDELSVSGSAEHAWSDLEALAQHLRELQTDFMHKYEIVDRKFKDKFVCQYKFLTLVKGDTGNLLLRDDDAVQLPSLLPTLSSDDFEKKLKQSFTDFLASFVRKTKVYLKVSSKKDFDELVALFEAEQEKECHSLLEWLRERSTSAEMTAQCLDKIKRLEATLETTKDEFNQTLKQKNDEIQLLNDQAEQREANLIVEYNATINKMQIDMGQVEKVNLSSHHLLEEKLNQLEDDKRELLNFLEIERRKLVETLEGHREETDLYEKTNQELKDQMNTFESFLKDVSEMVERERLANGNLRKELHQVKQSENELKLRNKKLNEKHELCMTTQTAEIEELQKQLNEIAEEKSELASINTELFEKIENLEQTKTLLTKQYEESQMEFRKFKVRNEQLIEDMKYQQQDSKGLLATLRDELKEALENAEELNLKNEDLNLDMEELTKNHEAQIKHLKAELNEAVKEFQLLQIQSNQIKADFEGLMQEKDHETEQLKSELNNATIALSEAKNADWEILHKLEESLQAKNAELIKQTKQLEEIKGVMSELESLKELVQEKDEILKELRSKLHESQHMTKNLKECNKELTEKLVKVSEDREIKCKNLLQKLRKTEEQVEMLELENKLHVKSGNGDLTMDELYEQLNECESRERNLRKVNAELGDKVRQLDYEKRTAIQDLLKELEQSQAGLQELNKLKSDLEEELKKTEIDSDQIIKQLTEKLNESNQQIRELKNKNADLVIKQEEICIKCENFKYKFDENEECLQKMKGQQKRTARELQKLSSERNDLREKLDESHRLVEELKNTLQLLGSGKDILRSQLNEKQNLEKRLHDLNSDLTKQLVKLEYENKDLKDELNENRVLLKEVQEMSDQFEKKLLKRNEEEESAKQKLITELNTYKERIRELETLNLNFLAEIKELGEQKSLSIAKLVNELNETQERIRDLQATNMNLHARLESVAALENSVEQLICEVNESHDYNKSLRFENEKLLQEWKFEQTEHMQAVKELLNELNESRANAHEHEKTNLEHIAKLKIEIEALKEANIRLQNELNECQQRVVDLQELNKNLSEHATNQFEYQTKEIECLKKGFDEAQQNVRELEKSKANLQLELGGTAQSQAATIEHLQAQLNDSQSRVKDLEIVYVELSKKIDDDHTDTIAEELLGELIESRKIVKQLEVYNEELSRKLQIQEQRSKLSNQELETDRYKLDRREMRELIDDHLAKLCECNGVINTLRESLSQKDEVLEIKTKHNEKLRQEITDLVQDLECTKEALTLKNKQMRKLEAKLNSSIEHFDTLFSTFGHKHAECYEMQTKCRVMEDAICRANKIRKTQEETIELLNYKICQLNATIEAHQIGLSKQGENDENIVELDSKDLPTITPAIPRRHKRHQNSNKP